MSTSTTFKFAASLVLALLSCHAWAERRAIRVDGFGDTWTTFDGVAPNGAGIGSANCPGTNAGSASSNTLIHLLGLVFSGRQSTAFLVDDYCQVANPGTLTEQNYFYADEPGLGKLFGDNPGNQITAIRYQMFDQTRFNSPSGFQWAFFSFPSDTTIVGLYGLESVTLTSTTFISSSVFNGQNGYNGEYFCFSGNTFIGTWDGDASEYASPCLKAVLGRVFGDGFEP